MIEFQISECGNKIAVKTPYNSKFVKTCRSLNGEWDGECWTFPLDLKDIIRERMMEIFGRDDRPCKLFTVKVTAVNGFYEARKGIELFGRPICQAFGRDGGTRICKGVSFVKGIPDSGGSIKNWSTEIPEGCVFIVRNVPEKMIEKERENSDISFEVTEETPQDKESLLQEKEALLERLKTIQEKLGEI